MAIKLDEYLLIRFYIIYEWYIIRYFASIIEWFVEVLGSLFDISG